MVLPPVADAGVCTAVCFKRTVLSSTRLNVSNPVSGSVLASRLPLLTAPAAARSPSEREAEGDEELVSVVEGGFPLHTAPEKEELVSVVEGGLLASAPGRSSEHGPAHSCTRIALSPQGRTVVVGWLAGTVAERSPITTTSCIVSLPANL